jgi:hypothetical protein
MKEADGKLSGPYKWKKEGISGMINTLEQAGSKGD